MTADQFHALAFRRFMLVAIVLPVVIVTVGVVVQLLALPHVPVDDRRALGRRRRAESATPRPGRSRSGRSSFGVGIPLLLGFATLPGLRRGDRGPTYRLMGAISAATAALVTVPFTWTLVMQAGDAGARDAPSVWPALIAALVAAVVVGVGRVVRPAGGGADAAHPRGGEPLSLAPGERVVWLRTASMAPAAGIALVLGVVALAVGGVRGVAHRGL